MGAEGENCGPAGLLSNGAKTAECGGKMKEVREVFDRRKGEKAKKERGGKRNIEPFFVRWGNYLQEESLGGGIIVGG